MLIDTEYVANNEEGSVSPTRMLADTRTQHTLQNACTTGVG
jgi:hypothetical protein